MCPSPLGDIVSKGTNTAVGLVGGTDIHNLEGTKEGFPHWYPSALLEFTGVAEVLNKRLRINGKAKSTEN